MNIQAMMKQAQKLQKDMMEEKEKIDHMEFEGSSSFVNVKVNGKKEVVKIKINQEKLEADDIELLEDMILVATNDALKKVDEITEKNMGKYTQGLPGIF